MPRNKSGVHKHDIFKTEDNKFIRVVDITLGGCYCYQYCNLISAQNNRITIGDRTIYSRTYLKTLIKMGNTVEV